MHRNRCPCDPDLPSEDSTREMSVRMRNTRTERREEEGKEGGEGRGKEKEGEEHCKVRYLREED